MFQFWLFWQNVDNNYWVSARTEALALEKAAKRFNVPAEKISLKQGTVQNINMGVKANIDQIYTKYQKNILICDISDHLPHNNLFIISLSIKTISQTFCWQYAALQK